jgi:CheY-like chemotaxis protein
MDTKEFVVMQIPVLVVEDDAIQRRQMARVLTEDGYTVALASTGDEAIRMLGEQRISIVLTDRKMPGTDGVDLLKHIKSTYPEILVAMVTAYPEGIEEHTLDALLTKPFKSQQLTDLVQYLVAKQSERNTSSPPQRKEIHPA